MSKESSIKVFAENFSGSDKPVNAISVWLENASAISGGGGGSFDPTYMSGAIDNKLNKDEVGFRTYYGTKYVSGVSGKNIFSDKATSASKSWEADWAHYDSNGYDLSQTHDNLTALNSFVQTNSASWAQGGGSDTNEKVLFHKYYSYDSYTGQTLTNNVSGVSSLYFECGVESYNQPQELIINQYGSEVARVYWTYVSSDGNYSYYSGSCNGLQTNSEYYVTGGSYQYCTLSANGYKTNPLNFTQFICTPDSVMNFDINGYNIKGKINGNGVFNTLTSFTGGLTGFTASGYNNYMINISYDDSNYGYNYDFSAKFGDGAKPTVTSGDVFPPTTGLQSNTTYYLAWNDNNGGLFWYQPGY